MPCPRTASLHPDRVRGNLRDDASRVERLASTDRPPRREPERATSMAT